MRFLFLIWAMLMAALPLRAEEVDVELLLMVDVSLSMSPEELEIQRRGYAEAIASDEVFAAISSGFTGRVAVAYVEWAGSNSHNIVFDWRLIETREDARAFASALDDHFPTALRRTSLTGALQLGQQMIETNEFEGLRRVIDISGDGPNNQGGAVDRRRDAVLSAGIVINGLPLMTRDGGFSHLQLDDLDVYYRACVTGGPGSFVLPVTRWEDFATAVRRKLVLELAGHSPRVMQAQFVPIPDYDCQIGEKLWQQYRNGVGQFGGP